MKFNFSIFPTITTQRLIIRQLTIDDSEAVFALRSNDKVNSYLDRKPATNISDALVFINKMNEYIASNNALYWAITATETNSFAGTICLFNFFIENKTCEIGFELLPSFQKQGIMWQALNAVIDYAFNTLEIEVIMATVHRKNEASLKLLSKFEFEKSISSNIPDAHLASLLLRKNR